MIEKLFCASGTAGWWCATYYGMQWSKPACTSTALLFGGLLLLAFEYSKSDGEK